jgi:membrane protein YqaA with SNARE-associated domain
VLAQTLGGFVLTVSLDSLQEWIVSMDVLRQAVETATGWVGLAIVAIYSFLIAIVLPLPSETVLAAPIDILPAYALNVGLIMLVSGLGKAAGSVIAFQLGQGVKKSGPVMRGFERLGFDVEAWARNTTAQLTNQYGYAGLAVALSVPFFPDTVSIYAFSVFGDDTRRFAFATFVGSVGRLVVTVAVVQGVLVVW